MFSGLAIHLQNMATPHYSVFVAVLAALNCYLFYLIWRNLHRARIIEDTPTARVRSAAQGYVELEGYARQLPEQTHVAPLTGTPCVWFRFKIEEQRSSSGSSGSHWSVVESRHSSEPFIFFDQTGDCLVDPRGSEVLPGARKVWYGSTRWPGAASKPGMFGPVFGKRFRYTEERIDAGEVYILGWFDTVRGSETSISQDVSALLREWKRDPKLLNQRFDSNSDGVLDEAEWHQARQAARRQASRERAERAVQAEINQLRASEHDGQPFLISAKPQFLITERYRRYALFSLLGALLVTAVLAWILTARFTTGS
jgi:hypothetical protein